MFEANTRLNIFWVINYTVKPPSVYNSPQIYINSCRFFKYLQVFTRNLDEKPEIKNTCRFFEYLQVSVCFLIPQFNIYRNRHLKNGV